MITHIEGRLAEKTPTYAVIDCSGVGYMLNISLNTFSKLGAPGDKCKLYSHTLVNTMDYTQTMYGFSEESERTFFRHLISVSGVGGNTARMFLSSFAPSELQQTILAGNVAALRSVKGIGDKTAQRIIVDLKDKVGKEDTASTFSMMPHNTIREEALSALVMLGFAKNLAEKSLDKVIRAATSELSVEQAIKQTLKNL